VAQQKVSRKARRQQEREARRAATKEVQKIQTRRRRAGKFALALVGVISGLVGFLASAGSLLPRLTVEPQFTWDQRAPLTTQFVVRNAGFLPLRDIRRDCVFVSFNGEEIVASKNTCDNCFNNLDAITNPHPIAVELPLDGAVTTNCNFIGSDSEDETGTYETMQPDRVDMAVVLRYRSIVWPWRRTQAFRFMTSIDRAGNVQWLRKPINDELADRIEQLGKAPIIRYPAGWRFAVKKPEREKPPSSND
jgi:hypothetical protein